MISNKYLTAEIMGDFPDITQEDIDEIKATLPAYIFFTSPDKNTKKCTCSSCGKTFTVTRRSRKVKFADVKHVGIGHTPDKVCPKCGAKVLYKKQGYGLGGLVGWDKVCVLRAQDNDLYIRGFYVDYNYNKNTPEIKLNERHRYYAGAEGAHHWERRSIYWVSMKSENEPIFGSGFGGNYDINEYLLLNQGEIQKSCLRYCQWEQYKKVYGMERPIAYLCFMAKHPNAEYLIKTGFMDLVNKILRGYTGLKINWRSNDIKKMLGLNKTEMAMKPLHEFDRYKKYKIARKLVPTATPAQLLQIVGRYWNSLDDVQTIKKQLGISGKRILNYGDRQIDNGAYNPLSMWVDYINECRYLGYDLQDESITMPGNLERTHRRTSRMVADLKEIERAKLKAAEIADMEKRMTKRYQEIIGQGMEYEAFGLKIVVPKSYQEIVDEGKALGHCVGGYAPRHARGALNILFIRKTGDPETPYYTIEVSKEKKIIQCRGHHNCHNDADVLEFEKEFALHLAGKAAKKKTKQKAAVQAA